MSRDYERLRDFTATVAAAGCGHFIVHARKAVLGGLSPRENREVPPLRYDVVQRLAAEFPRSGSASTAACAPRQQSTEALGWADGVMLGREAYHRPGSARRAAPAGVRRWLAASGCGRFARAHGSVCGTRGRGRRTRGRDHPAHTGFAGGQARRAAASVSGCPKVRELWVRGLRLRPAYAGCCGRRASAWQPNGAAA